MNVPDPPGVTTVHVETARDMLHAVERALPADVAIFAAAVADWRVANAGAQKIKKAPARRRRHSRFAENPDILSTIAHRKAQRPKLVIGFAAETENVVANAKAKLARKGCDWIVANDVSPQTGIMGGDRNTIELVTANGVEAWPPQSKDDVAAMLIARIADALTETKREHIDVRITRLPHGDDLPLPSYQSAHAAGLDLIAAVPARRAAHARARRARAGSDRHRHRAARRPRGAGAAALGARRAPRPHRAQRARHHRRRLPRRGAGAADQSRQRSRSASRAACASPNW